MTFLFELHRRGKAKTYGNVTFKLQIQTEKKKIRKCKSYGCHSNSSETTVHIVDYPRLIYTPESSVLPVISYVLTLHGV